MRRAAGPLLVAWVAALIGGVATGVAGAESRKIAGTAISVEGPVTVTRLAAGPRALKVRDPLFAGDLVEVPKGGAARIFLGGKTTVTVRELSRLTLREETFAGGLRYTVELIAGKVRASVGRMLMRSGEEVEVRTRNAVASVRGTDFLVEALERPVQTQVLGLLGLRGVWQEGWERLGETRVITLSGRVAVSNRLSPTGRVAQIGTAEAAQVSGSGDPVRLRGSIEALKWGATPPPGLVRRENR